MLIVAAAAAARAGELVIEADQVLVSWQAKSGGKQYTGVSRTMSWTLLSREDGETQVQLHVPVESFDSGHPEVDSRLRAATESGRYPFVDVEGVVRGEHFVGTVTLHGRTRPLSTALNLSRNGSQLAAHTSFSIPLDQFGIQLPEVDNQVSVEFDARLIRDPLAVISKGWVGSN